MADQTMAQLALEALNASRDDVVRLDRRFDVGAKGAYAVRCGHDGTAVLKCWTNSHPHREERGLRLPRIQRLRELGWPIPKLMESGLTRDVIYELWELAPGQPGVNEVVPAGVIAQAGALVESARNAALGDGLDWPGWLERSIRNSIERAARNASEDGMRLLAACHQALGICVLVPGRDIIHGDFGPANCLIDQARIVAVVDFDECRDGDGTLDLLGLAWDLEGWKDADAEEMERLWARILAAATPAYGRVLAAYWVAGSLAWAAGTSDEAHIVNVSARVLGRFD